MKTYQKTTFITLLLISLCSYSIFAQSKSRIKRLKKEVAEGLKDTALIMHYFDISNDYYLYHDDSLDIALKYLDMYEEYAKNHDLERWMGTCYNMRGTILMRMERLEEAMASYDAGMASYLRYNDSMKYMMLYDNKGYILADLGRYDEALVIKRKACDYFIDNSDSSTISASIYGIAWIYMEKGEYGKALPLLHQSRFYAPNWDLLQGEIYGNMMIAHRELGNPDSTAICFRRALRLSEPIPSSAMINLYEFGMAKEKLGELDSALYYVNRAVNMDGADHSGEEYNIFRMDYAKLLAETGKTQKGINVFTQALPHVENTQNIKHKLKMYYAGYKIYEEVGNSDKALKYYKLYQKEEQHRKEEKLEKSFKEIETKYETEKKSQMIKELALKDELNSTRLTNRNRWLWVLGFGLLGLIGLLYRIFMQKQVITTQKDDLTVALNDKNVLLKEIHHRVKNNLQVISSLLGLQSRFVKDATAAEALKIGKSRVQSMALLHQKLYTNKDLKSVNIKDYFEDLILNLMDTYKINDERISFETDIDDLILDIDTVVPLGLITNELISNAFKHAFEEGKHGKIWLSVKQIGEEVQLRLRDNGRGVPFTTIPEKTESLGLQLIKSFSEKLDGDLAISNNEGSEFVLTFVPESKL